MGKLKLGRQLDDGGHQVETESGEYAGYLQDFDRETAENMIDCYNALNTVHDPIGRKRIAQLEKEIELCREAERSWESTMMEAVGEDGVGCVREKIDQIRGERDRLQRALNNIYDFTVKELRDFVQGASDV